MHPDKLNSVHELRKPLERIVFALNRHYERIRGGKRIERKQSQRRRAVYKHIVIVVGDFIERTF